jgi:hypothetical protein
MSEEQAERMIAALEAIANEQQEMRRILTRIEGNLKTR